MISFCPWAPVVLLLLVSFDALHLSSGGRTHELCANGSALWAANFHPGTVPLESEEGSSPLVECGPRRLPDFVLRGAVVGFNLNFKHGIMTFGVTINGDIRWRGDPEEKGFKAARFDVTGDVTIGISKFKTNVALKLEINVESVHFSSHMDLIRYALSATVKDKVTPQRKPGEHDDQYKKRLHVASSDVMATAAFKEIHRLAPWKMSKKEQEEEEEEEDAPAEHAEDHREPALVKGGMLTLLWALTQRLVVFRQTKKGGVDKIDQLIIEGNEEVENILWFKTVEPNKKLDPETFARLDVWVQEQLAGGVKANKMAALKAAARGGKVKINECRRGNRCFNGVWSSELPEVEMVQVIDMLVVDIMYKVVENIVAFIAERVALNFYAVPQDRHGKINLDFECDELNQRSNKVLSPCKVGNPSISCYREVYDKTPKLKASKPLGNVTAAQLQEWRDIWWIPEAPFVCAQKNKMCDCRGTVYFGLKCPKGQKGCKNEEEATFDEVKSNNPPIVQRSIRCKAKDWGIADPYPGFPKQCWCDPNEVKMSPVLPASFVSVAHAPTPVLRSKNDTTYPHHRQRQRQELTMPYASSPVSDSEEEEAEDRSATGQASLEEAAASSHLELGEEARMQRRVGVDQDEEEAEMELRDTHRGKVTAGDRAFTLSASGSMTSISGAKKNESYKNSINGKARSSGSTNTGSVKVRRFPKMFCNVASGLQGIIRNQAVEDLDLMLESLNLKINPAVLALLPGVFKQLLEWVHEYTEFDETKLDSVSKYLVARLHSFNRLMQILQTYLTGMTQTAFNVEELVSTSTKWMSYVLDVVLQKDGPKSIQKQITKQMGQRKVEAVDNGIFFFVQFTGSLTWKSELAAEARGLSMSADVSVGGSLTRTNVYRLACTNPSDSDCMRPMLVQKTDTPVFFAQGSLNGGTSSGGMGLKFQLSYTRENRGDPIPSYIPGSRFLSSFAKAGTLAFNVQVKFDVKGTFEGLIPVLAVFVEGKLREALVKAIDSKFSTGIKTTLQQASVSEQDIKEDGDGNQKVSDDKGSKWQEAYRQFKMLMMQTIGNEIIKYKNDTGSTLNDSVQNVGVGIDVAVTVMLDVIISVDVSHTDSPAKVKIAMTLNKDRVFGKGAIMKAMKDVLGGDVKIQFSETAVLDMSGLSVYKTCPEVPSDWPRKVVGFLGFSQAATPKKKKA